MLNTVIRMGNTNVQLNTPSTGMMQRSHPKSKFIRFQKGSVMEKEIFPTSGSHARIEVDNYRTYKDIAVLQVMVFGDNFYLCEVVLTSDLTEGGEQ